MSILIFFRHSKLKFYLYWGIILCVSLLYYFNIFHSPPNQELLQDSLTTSQILECQNPNLDPFEPVFMKFYKKIPPLDCSSKENWIKVSADGSSASILASAVSAHGEISCSFAPLIRESQEKNTIGPAVTIKNNAEFQFKDSDFAVVKCKAEDGKTWKNVMAGLRANVDLNDREEAEVGKRKPNVVILSFDSISRNQYIRMLPNTYKLLTEMGAISLNTYNIVGDGTPAAFIPILTGRTEQELPDVRKTSKNPPFVGDVYPFIWKDFKKAGYVTMFGEDAPTMGTFTYRLTGFNTPPTDHFLVDFYREQPQEECFMGTSAHQVALEWNLNILRKYSRRPKFLVHHGALLSHGDYNNIQKVDDDVVNIIMDMKEENILEDTIFILMSDHGPRFSEEIRSTLQGKLEERLPMFSMLFPSWFKKEYGLAYEALLHNQDRLTTAFDIHDTLRDVLEGTISKPRNTDRSQSLFSPIPSSRSCSSSGVEAHWCACQAWQEVNIKDPIAVKAANALLDAINNYTAGYRQYCQLFKLKAIDKAGVAKSKKEVLGFVRKVVKLDGKSVLGFDTDGEEAKAATELVQVSVLLEPGNANFEATFKHQLDTGVSAVKIDDISRTNKYGDQPACIIDVNISLRKFCVCK